MKQSKFRLFLFICVLFIFYSGTMAVEADDSKQICITFDDLPVVRVHNYKERAIITDAILSTLKDFSAPAAGFVVGDNIEGHFDLLELWLEAGHILGNHTYSHPDINRVPIERYIENIERGGKAIEALLMKANQTGRYFRAPLLHYGSNNPIKKQLADYLSSVNLINSHVSIDTDDFAYNQQYEQSFLAADSATIDQLKNKYIDHIIEQLKVAEELSQDIIGRNCRHILLLHANRLNSVFLTDILNELVSRNYRFISLGEALSDPVYAMPETYTGVKGISILERLEKSGTGFQLESR